MLALNRINIFRIKGKNYNSYFRNEKISTISNDDKVYTQLNKSVTVSLADCNGSIFIMIYSSVRNNDL